MWNQAILALFGLKDLEGVTGKTLQAGNSPASCSLCTQGAKVLSLMNLKFSQNFYELVTAMFFFFFRDLHVPWTLHLLNKDVFLGHSTWKYIMLGTF